MGEKKDTPGLNETLIHKQMFVTASESEKSDFTWSFEGSTTEKGQKSARVCACAAIDAAAPAQTSLFLLSMFVGWRRWVAFSFKQTNGSFPKHIFEYYCCSPNAGDFPFTAKAIATKPNERSKGGLD